MLTIRGEKKVENESQDRTFSERFYGRFERQLSFDRDVDQEAVTAAFKTLVLTVTVPRTPQAIERRKNAYPSMRRAKRIRSRRGGVGSDGSARHMKLLLCRWWIGSSIAGGVPGATFGLRLGVFWAASDLMTAAWAPSAAHSVSTAMRAAAASLKYTLTRLTLSAIAVNMDTIDRVASNGRPLLWQRKNADDKLALRPAFAAIA